MPPPIPPRTPASRSLIHQPLTGAFGVVRHPNYALYTLWRIGFASITGSLTNVILQTAFQIGFFSQFSVGELGDYMQKRYGAEYTVSYSCTVIKANW